MGDYHNPSATDQSKTFLFLQKLKKHKRYLYLKIQSGLINQVQTNCGNLK